MSYAIAAFPVAGIVTYAVSYPLGLPFLVSLVLFAVAWWAIYRFSVRRWPEG